MNKVIKKIVLGCLVTLFALGVSSAQNNTKHTETINQETGKAKECEAASKHSSDEFYDPLTPQLFVFDKANNVFGAINAVDNSIDIIHYQNGGLEIAKRILVDNHIGRHDVHFIYRPQGIAIYENHLVYLASHRDSCYLSVLTLDGRECVRVYFKGRAYAFSYSKSDQELYIAGQNEKGYDLIAISTAKGIENISLESTPSLHYRKPQKASEILEADPFGGGLAVIAMGVVFLGLLILAISFMSTGKALTFFQNRRAMLLNKKQKTQDLGAVTGIKKPSSMSGEEFAAIAAAIYMYNNELHDTENTVLTFQNKVRSWTPWNAKLYGMNTYFKNR